MSDAYTPPTSDYYGVESGRFQWSGTSPWPGEGYPAGTYPTVPATPSTPAQTFGYPTEPVAAPLQGDPRPAPVPPPPTP
jgi:hypothetical protein